jgi:uncharacterized membrane protein YphA (DoxX/SURF4 family)
VAVLEIVFAALAIVLVVSGVLKVRDPDSTTPMLGAVGLPSSRVAVYAVATLEVVVGAAALVIGGRLATALVGALFAGFAVIGAVLVRSGASVSCGCFGQRSGTMTPLHVAVNAAAAMVALVAAAVGTNGLFTGTADRSMGVLAVATFAAVLLAAGVVALLTVVPERVGATPRPAPLAAADERPGAGTGAGTVGLHVVEGLTPDGDRALIEPAGSDRVILLAFLTSGCTTCSHFWDVFSRLAAADLPGDRTDLVIVARGDDQENPNRIRDLAPAEHLVIRSSAAWRDYGIVAGPSFVLLDGRRDVVLGQGAATTWADVEGLLRRAVGPVPPAGVAE